MEVLALVENYEGLALILLVVGKFDMLALLVVIPLAVDTIGIIWYLQLAAVLDGLAVMMGMVGVVTLVPAIVVEVTLSLADAVGDVIGVAVRIDVGEDITFVGVNSLA